MASSQICSAASRSKSKSFKRPATLDVLSGRPVHRRDRLAAIRPQVWVVDRLCGYLRPPQGVQDRGKVLGQVLAPRVDGGVRTRPPQGVHHRSSGPLTSAPDSPWSGSNTATTSGTETGNSGPSIGSHVASFEMARRPSGLARQSHEELVPETEQGVRRAARCQPAHRRVRVIRHRPPHQPLDQLRIDRNLVGMQSSSHTWTQSHGVVTLQSSFRRMMLPPPRHAGAGIRHDGWSPERVSRKPPQCPLRLGDPCSACVPGATGPADCPTVALVMSDPDLRERLAELRREYLSGPAPARRARSRVHVR